MIERTPKHPHKDLPRSAFCCDGMWLNQWHPCDEPERPLDEFGLFDVRSCGGCELAWDLLDCPRSDLRRHVCFNPLEGTRVE